MIIRGDVVMSDVVMSDVVMSDVVMSDVVIHLSAAIRGGGGTPGNPRALAQ